MSRINLNILLAIFFIFCSINSYADCVKIGIVDMEKVAEESSALKDISDQINIKQAELNGYIQDNDKLYKEKEDLNKTREIMDEDQYNSKIQDLEEQINRNQQNVQNINFMNQMAHSKFMEDFGNFITQASQNVMDNLGLQVIIPKSYTFSYNSNLDVTEYFRNEIDMLLKNNNINFIDYYKQLNDSHK